MYDYVVHISKIYSEQDIKYLIWSYHAMISLFRVPMFSIQTKEGFSVQWVSCWRWVCLFETRACSYIVYLVYRKNIILIYDKLIYAYMKNDEEECNGSRRSCRSSKWVRLCVEMWSTERVIASWCANEMCIMQNELTSNTKCALPVFHKKSRKYWEENWKEIRDVHERRESSSGSVVPLIFKIMLPARIIDS